MYKLIQQRIINKKWLTICLILGVSLLIGILSCQPMFKMGALNKLLSKKFENSIQENNKYPSVLTRKGSFSAGEGSITDIGISKTNNYENIWMEYLEGIDTVNTQIRMFLAEKAAVGEYSRTRAFLLISYMPNMEEHIEILKGQSVLEYDQEGDVYPCYMSQKCMDDLKLVVGETVTFEEVLDENGNKLQLLVVGVIKESDVYDTFWYDGINEFEKSLFIDKEAFDEISEKYAFETIYYSHSLLIDYNDIKSNNIEDLEYYLQEFVEGDQYFTYSFEELVKEYKDDKSTINIIIWVLELPILGMVLAFIYMVSSQITKLEKNEISMFKSRGMSRLQIVLVYITQSSVLSVISMFIGLPLGYLLCKMAAGTTDFLTFSMNDLSLYRFNISMIGYGLFACIIGIVCIVLPVIPATKISITEHKSSLTQSKKMVWEKYFFDIILLVVSVYLLINFNKNLEDIRSNALVGNKMDPMIFLNSTLFIIALGLVVLRLIHYGVILVYYIGKKKWKPAMYASFLQITRTFDKQGFISVFLILTIAMGIFNTNTARTINQNNEDRIEYNLGADVVLQQKWELKTFLDRAKVLHYNYIEPDYQTYLDFEGEYVEGVTRVIKDYNVLISKGNTNVEGCTIMGIHTREFGEVANFKDELNVEKHWYESLNSLGKSPNGVIISSNLATLLDVKVGDKITCSRFNVVTAISDELRGVMEVTIQDIVDDWPGYNKYYYEDKELKENYLVVCNYSSVIGAFQISPYEVWMKQDNAGASYDIYNILDDKGIELDSFLSKEDQIKDMKESPMIQITNGLFTLSFVIALILCGVGFLIYWITSIKQRELLFGIYRAMGLSMKNINRMLINEHIFSTFPAVIAGGGVGIVTTTLFVKLFGIIYLPQKHNLDVYTYYEIWDLIKLIGVILVMIVICIFILRTIVKKMNITQALKLGEE